jgi:NlpC/P60 family putative phage cell wall peptidase
MSETPAAAALDRAAIVAEARSWIGTPYHLGARVKGAGCDCATLIAEVLIACGLADREGLGVYSQDWFFHTSNERYLMGLLRHAAKTVEAVAHGSAGALPGDIVLTRLARSKVYNHGAIVTAWPKVIHAIQPQVEEINAATHPLWTYRAIAVFTPGFTST